MRSTRIGFDASALRNPAFRLLGIGQIISVVGEQILTVAITVTILNAGGNAASVGLVLATRGLASVIFLLLGGVWADRLRRRRILITAYAIIAAATWILALVPSRLSSSFWLLAAVIFVAGATDAFIRPAFAALLRSALTDDQRVSGRALVSISMRIGVITGPALGVVLATRANPEVAFGVTAAIFASLAILIWLIAEPLWVPVRGKSMIADIVSGVGEARRHPWLVTLLLFSPVSIMLVIAPSQVLLPILSRESFGSFAVYGTALACFGAGGLGGSLLAMVWRPQSPGKVAMVSMSLYALIPFGLIYAPASWVLFGCYLVAGFGVETYALTWDVAVQREFPDHLIGRITSLAWLSSFGLMPFGLALTGPMTNTFGNQAVLLLAAGLVLIIPPSTLLVSGMTSFHTTLPDRDSQK